MKHAYALTAYNKVAYVGDAVFSMFAQKCPHPLEIILSDHGSTDGTKEELDRLAAGYGGPHKVRRLDCPLRETRGMPGLNDHLNWIMSQTDADVVSQLSADDYDLAQRMALVIEAQEKFNPSMVLGAMYTVSVDKKYKGETPFLTKDGWCVLEEMLPNYIGGSTIQTWTAEFFHKVGGLQGVGSPDVVLPFLAILHKGAYYLHTKAHCYRQVFGPKNTGLESVYHYYKEGTPERLQWEELIHFQVLTGHYTSLMKMDKLELTPELRGAAGNALAKAILDRSASWSNVRQAMSFKDIPPLAFKTH